MALDVRIDQKLEQDAKLVFKFPHPTGNKPAFSRTCPFFENPTIKEEQTANLIKYDVIGRSGNVFGYTGAKSRTFNISFFITLPHILELSRGLTDSQPTPSDLSKEEQKNAFFIDSGDDENFDNGYFKNAFKYINRIAPDESSELSFLEENYASLGVALDSTTAQAMDLILYWANLIRSSTLTYSPNPSVGPPTIRFTHGSLYRDIATVASRYNISVDDRYGYDTVTLLPRRLEVALTLHEVQSNTDLGFEQGRDFVSDSIAGWEQVVGRRDLPRTTA